MSPLLSFSLRRWEVCVRTKFSTASCAASYSSLSSPLEFCLSRKVIIPPFVISSLLRSSGIGEDIEVREEESKGDHSVTSKAGSLGGSFGDS